MTGRMSPTKRLARFEKKIERTQETGCWIWLGTRTRNGYGTASWNKRPTTAHRVIYQLLVGEIPEGMDLDHLCRNKLCVNPTHLEPVSRRENLKRTFDFRGCINGHPFSEENTSIVHRSSGEVFRRCKICHRERNKRAKRRHGQLA